MDEFFNRHELFPYIFEEQTIILMDRAGKRETRKLRRYSRTSEDGTLSYLLVFDTPSEIQGVAVLGVCYRSGLNESSIYLPALGKMTKSGSADSRKSYFLGTDFTIEDLIGEFMSNFRYVRVKDRKIDNINCYVVNAYSQEEFSETNTNYSERQHFIRKDNNLIIRTDYFDFHHHLMKRQTHSDLTNVNGDMWRGNMILMDNHREQHKSLIKINRRVFSHDYVPTELFTKDWLLNNRHIKSIDDMLVENASRITTTE